MSNLYFNRDLEITDAKNKTKIQQQQEQSTRAIGIIMKWVNKKKIKSTTDTSNNNNKNNTTQK